MKYAVDRIIDNIVILENIDDNTKKEVSKDILPKDIREGTILIETETYIIDKEEELKRRKNIEERLNKIRD